MTTREWFCLFAGWVIGSFGLLEAVYHLVGVVVGIMLLTLVGGFAIATSRDLKDEFVLWLKSRRLAREAKEDEPLTEYDRVRRSATTLRVQKSKR